jgi:hypothetical protein
MSELRNIMVNTTDVRVGDLLGLPGRPVTSIDVKVKWVYATVEGRKNPVELRRDDRVMVGRVMLTDAEQAEADAAAEAAKAASLLDAKLQWLDREERQATAKLAHQQAKMTEMLAANRVVGYSRIEDLLEAQTAFAAWDRVRHASVVAAMKAIDFDPYTEVWTVAPLAEVASRLDGLAQVKEVLRDEVLSYRAASQSTSVMSNACDAVAHDAKRAFISRW